MGEDRDGRTRTLKTVLGEIGGGDILPWYLIYGDEDYLVNDSLNQIIHAILPGGDTGLNLFWLDGESADIETIYETILTPPLIPGKKVVAVKKTRLFYSKASLPDIIGEVIHAIESDPPRAGKAFVSFLQTAGWSFEELQEDGWKKISDEEWRKTVGPEHSAIRNNWVPQVLAICARFGLTAKETIAQPDLLQDVFEKGLPYGNCLILTADYVDKRKKLFRMISESGGVLYYPKVKGEERQKTAFLRAAEDILARRGKKFSLGALQALGQKTGFHLRESLGELEKIIAYTADKEYIDEDAIHEVTGKTKEDSVFDLTSAIVEKDIVRALSTVRDLLDHGVHSLMIVTMLAREVRLLLQGTLLIESGIFNSYRSRMTFSEFRKNVYPHITAMDAGEGKKKNLLFGQHPYVVYNALKNCGRFSRDELVGYLEQLGEIDRAMKSTGKDPKLLLERFLVEVCASHEVGGWER